MARIPPELVDRAHALRRGATDAESLMWRLLRGRQLGGAKFRRQHVLGSYIVDFCCLEDRLCVELDGGQHAEDEAADYDARRDGYLRARGFRVLRFWNHEVLTETQSVLETIWDAVHAPGEDTDESPRR